MAIEVKTGDVLNQVRVLTRHMVPDGDFTLSSFPSKDDLDQAIVTAEAEIFQWLASLGYDTDTTNWPDVAKNYLSRYNAFGAAYLLEFAHSGATFGAVPATRGETYFRLYQSLKSDLLSGKLQLTDLGVPVKGVRAVAAVTGTSDSEKDVLEEDTDWVEPFFSREKFKHPGTAITQEQLRKT